MRIGLFTDTYYPQINGLATSVLMLNKYLQALGHQVFVVTTTDPDAPKYEENVYRLPSMPFLAERRMGMFYHPRLARLVRQLDLDLIHTHSEFALGVFGRYMARELRLPMMHTMHTIYEDYTHYLTKGLPVINSLAKVIARKFTADFCNSADHVIVPTEKMKSILLSYGVRAGLTTIPTGIEIDRFGPDYFSRSDIQGVREELGISQREKVLLYLGRVAEEKNIQELFYSMRSYLKETEGIRFLLVGDGQDRHRLEALAKELDMIDKTIFAGAKSWYETGKYYHACDVFISASQSEAQGLTYIEAMAAGLPVVAKADDCLSGILQDGVNGYAFKDGDGLVKALDRILTNDLEREKLGKGAMETAERFSAQEYASRIAGEYSSLLEKTHGGVFRKTG